MRHARCGVRSKRAICSSLMAPGAWCMAAAVAAVGAVSPWAIAAPNPDVPIESRLNDVPTPRSLRGWHDLLGSEPHVAGTPGDQRTADRLADAFELLGLEVQRHAFWAYLPRSVDAAVEIESPVAVVLPLIEDQLAEDPFTSHRDLAAGWNAYSGSGDVTGAVVYANYGTKEDFDRLAELGVEIGGSIVVARYGKNYRGYKAKFAEQAGAAALIIYTDPDDSGYRRGIPYPEGGYANPSSIQRGSIKTLAYPGDPLTPHVPATPDARRLDPGEVALPHIPVQPLGWKAAAEILSRMTGPAVPATWQGGLPFAYRLTGGVLRVRVMVKQQRKLTRSENVLGILRGSTDPDRRVIVGCHHDAWGFGAADPLAGTIVLAECAKSFSEMARRGDVADRTIVFAAWGAEEFGIIGSVEWCEANRDDLLRDAVAYVNLDMAAMGPDFHASSSPTLKPLIYRATQAVPQPGSSDGRSVYESWAARNGAAESASGFPAIGNLGGGSDHIGFYCHLGIPSCGLGGGGSKGVSYHSNYDTLAWYRKVVGEDYEAALMLTRVTNLIVARLAGAAVLPLDPTRYAADIATHLSDLRKRAGSLGLETSLSSLEQAVVEFESAAAATQQKLDDAVAAGRLSPETQAEVNAVLIGLERAWLHEPGLPQRPWFRSLYAATDPDSGYAAWMLPALRYHVEVGDADGLAQAELLYVEVFARLLRAVEAIDRLLSANPEP